MKKTILQMFGVAILSCGLCLTACAEGKVDSPAGKASGSKPSTTEASVKAETGGIKAADFTLKDLKGETVKLSDYSGKVIILDFWATWCPPCVKEIPHFNDLSQEYSDKGLVVLGVSVDRDGVQAVHKFKKKSAIDYRVAMYDQATYDTYQNYLPQEMRGGIPFTFVIDRQGNIQEHFVGYRPKEVFVKAIEPLL